MKRFERERFALMVSSGALRLMQLMRRQRNVASIRSLNKITSFQVPEEPLVNLNMLGNNSCFSIPGPQKHQLFDNILEMI